jgi:hypothetical protein
VSSLGHLEPLSNAAVAASDTPASFANLLSGQPRAVRAR